MPKRGADEAEAKDGKEDLPDLLTKSIEHCWGNGFLDIFREYFRKHAAKFEVVANGTSGEHRLEFQELFNEYLLIFEGKLEEFIEGEGSTIHDFYAVIKQHQTNSDPQVQLFIHCLLASADYDSFFSVMKKEAEKNLRRRACSVDHKGTPQDEKEGERNLRSSSDKESARLSRGSPRGEYKESGGERLPEGRAYK